LAIRLALVLIVFDYADNFLCISLQLGRIRLSLRNSGAVEIIKIPIIDRRFIAVRSFIFTPERPLLPPSY